MKSIYILAYRNIISGGCENLIGKLAVQLKTQYYADVRCVFEKISSEYRSLLSENDVALDEIFWNKVAEYCTGIEHECYLRIITFEWDTFLSFFYCDRANKKTLLYAVHPNCIKGFGEDEDLRKLYKNEAGGLIRILAQDHHIVAMDEIVKNCSERYFGSIPNLDLLRICVDVSDNWTTISEYIRQRYDKKILLTAARAEFPFKGYILGLLNWMKQQSDEKLKLRIVSFGEKFHEIERELDKAPDKVKEKVTLYNKLPYDDLKKLLNETFLYAGMGTSVLDAAVMGVPTIPIRPDTYEVLCNSRFDENPYSICADDMYEYKDFTEMVDQVLRLDGRQYALLAEKTYACVCSEYNSVEMIRKLVDLMNTAKDDGEFSDTEITVWKALENNYSEHIRQMICSVKEKAYGRKIVIYGAGKGGRDIYFLLKDNGFKVDCFVDERFEKLNHLFALPVYSPTIIKKDEMFVIVSLKRYTRDVSSFLERLGFAKEKDYIYPYCGLGKEN